ncbi:hypothetical protein VNO77_03084 [Canavalia gladiata]|uniref:Uncharacterized protein n=1 Tax=Canavalia gladiata TaxID=3824 RepID=A0AAN9R3J0_CANGL
MKQKGKNRKAKGETVIKVFTLEKGGWIFLDFGLETAPTLEKRSWNLCVLLLGVLWKKLQVRSRRPRGEPCDCLDCRLLRGCQLLIRDRVSQSLTSRTNINSCIVDEIGVSDSSLQGLNAGREDGPWGSSWHKAPFPAISPESIKVSMEEYRTKTETCANLIEARKEVRKEKLLGAIKVVIGDEVLIVLWAFCSSMSGTATGTIIRALDIPRPLLQRFPLPFFSCRYCTRLHQEAIRETLRTIVAEGRAPKRALRPLTELDGRSRRWEY